jgi:hypothetical protein
MVSERSTFGIVSSLQPVRLGTKHDKLFYCSSMEAQSFPMHEVLEKATTPKPQNLGYHVDRDPGYRYVVGDRALVAL